MKNTPKQSSVKVRYFRVIEGRHYDHNKKLYKKGDVVESIEDLSELFVNKFEEVTADAAGIRSRVVEVEKAEDTEPESFQGFGKDVTSKFPTAEDAGIKVFRNEKKQYFLVDADGDETKALNKRPLEKSAVASAIEMHAA